MGFKATRAESRPAPAPVQPIHPAGPGFPVRVALTHCARPRLPFCSHPGQSLLFLNHKSNLQRVFFFFSHFSHLHHTLNPAIKTAPFPSSHKELSGKLHPPPAKPPLCHYPQGLARHLSVPNPDRRRPPRARLPESPLTLPRMPWSGERPLLFGTVRKRRARERAGAG